MYAALQIASLLVLYVDFFFSFFPPWIEREVCNENSLIIFCHSIFISVYNLTQNSFFLSLQLPFSSFRGALSDFGFSTLRYIYTSTAAYTSTSTILHFEEKSAKKREVSQNSECFSDLEKVFPAITR